MTRSQASGYNEERQTRTPSTIHSVGVEWDLTGDADHDATCKVQYRVKGTNAWQPALPLFRVDFYGWYADTQADRAYNMLAGSVLFLQPDTTYEVQLHLSDPDGGASRRTLTIRTRPMPSLPKGLEPDYGYANNRLWRNRITNAHNNALSFQPMYCGPWYFIRNQVVGRGRTG